MSAIDSNGLVGVSTQMSRVLCVIALFTSSRLVRAAGVWEMPHWENTLSIRRKVPPYASSGMTTWSPGRSIARSAQSVAAMPELNARPNAPPSTAARDVSSAARVGLPVRAYSKPPRRPPTPSWANVELA